MKMSKLGYVLVALVIISVAGASSAWAGASAFAGMAMPTGNFGEAASPGYYIGGAYAMPVTPVASVGIRGAYNRFAWQENVDGNYNAVEALAFGRIAAPTGPFGLVGVGFSNGKAVVGDLESDRETDLAIAIGGGYSLTKFEVTAMYHTISTPGDSVNYFTLSAGLGF